MNRAFRIEVPDWYRGDDPVCIEASIELGQLEDEFMAVPGVGGTRRLATSLSECSRFMVWEGSYPSDWSIGIRLETMLLSIAGHPATVRLTTKESR